VKIGRAFSAAFCLLGTACPSGPARPLAITKSVQIRPYVRNARLTRSLVVDGGLLRLDPSSAMPTLSEKRAVALWESANYFEGPLSTKDAVVFLARTTMHAHGDGYGLRRAAPAFEQRDAWVFVWNPGPQYCAHTGGPIGTLPPKATSSPRRPPRSRLHADPVDRI